MQVFDMKNSLRYVLFALLARIFLSLVGGALIGITGELLSLAVCCAAFGFLRAKQVKKPAQGPGRSPFFFSVFSFSGVLLLCVPLSFVPGFLSPGFGLRANLFVRFSGAHFSLFLLAFLLSGALLFLAVRCVPDQTAGYPAIVRVIAGGAVFALCSLSFSLFAADFVFGCFLTAFFLRNRARSAGAAFLFFYRAFSFALLYFEQGAGRPYGAMMGGAQILGMALLFVGVAALLLLPDWWFTAQKKPGKPAMIFTLTASLLLVVIGCAVVQYLN